ncbi:MAG: hypothetical protein EOO52_17270 [Gammaproteobacteria bacterium]|nr:MAG: hypothetical protein EOO52_17270 [Gammaproteobacteria bacterium]
MKMQRLFLIAIPLIWVGCVISCSSADKKKAAPTTQTHSVPIAAPHSSDAVEEIQVANAKAAIQNAQALKRTEKEAKLAAPAPAPAALMAMREVAAPPPIPKTTNTKTKVRSELPLKNLFPHLVLM